MSIYDAIRKIGEITKVKHNVGPDKLIARFHLNGNVINYHFGEYNREVLVKHLSFDYDKIEISYYFWDPSFCKADMFMIEDIQYFETLDVFNGTVSWNAAAGFVLSLIGIYSVIEKSYSSDNFDQIVQTVYFDKQIFQKVFRHIDIVASMPDSLLRFIKNIFSDNILSAMVTPSGDFRFTVEDMDIITEGTSLVHEISGLVDTYVTDEVTKARYYLEILKNCRTIQTPFQICKISDDNIMLNICKLTMNIESHYSLVKALVSMYYDKGGTLVPINIPVDQKYHNFNIILQTFKNLHSVSSGDMF